jgi:hypothetical protein
MRFLCCLILVAACASDPSPPTLLPSDATFLEPDVPQCLANNPPPPDDPYTEQVCCHALTLFANGDVGLVTGPGDFPGSYTLDGDLARGTEDFGDAFTFDLATNIATGASMIAGPWIADPDNLAAVACYAQYGGIRP